MSGAKILAGLFEARDLLAARVTVAGRSMTVAELIAAHEREQWQPIETAPRGVPVLVAYDNGDVDIDYDYIPRPYQRLHALAARHVAWRPLPEPPAPTETEGA